MDSAVIIFESFSSLCLKRLAECVKGLPFSLRIFPLLLREGKIYKRWVYIENEGTSEFVEKKEAIENIKMFIKTLRKEPCIIFVDIAAGCFEKYHNKISQRKGLLSICYEKRCIISKSILDVYEGVIQCIFSFFNWAKTTATGIRLKNREGKKMMVETPIYFEKVDFFMPPQMEISPPAENARIVIGRVYANVPYKIVKQILSKNTLHFSSSGFYLKLETFNGQITATFEKDVEKIELLGSVHLSMCKYYTERFVTHLVKKYGKEIEGITKLLLYSKEKKATPIALKEEIFGVNDLSSEKKQKVILGAKELLETVKISTQSRKHELYTSLAEFCTKESYLLPTGEKQMYKYPSFPLLAPSGVSSLYTFIQSGYFYE